jgi:hypothetical protein
LARITVRYGYFAAEAVARLALREKAGRGRASSILAHPQRLDEGFLRNLDLAELAHALFARFLLFISSSDQN